MLGWSADKIQVIIKGVFLKVQALQLFSRPHCGKITSCGYPTAQRTAKGSALEAGYNYARCGGIQPAHCGSGGQLGIPNLQRVAYANREFRLRPEHFQAVQFERDLPDEVHRLAAPLWA